ncbi:MAG: pyridoxamine 5'-phosphate oxidase family protein [Flavobacteriaceae bacterium]|nr:pyridoxamine 5'-phosphate oxidase family protein [Flavobacteriaceae bacterium]
MKEYLKTDLNTVKRGANRATYDVKQIYEILDAGFIGFIGYTFQNRVISLPMAYGRIGDKLYLHGSQKNKMLLALIEIKEISMTVMHLDGLVLARSGLHHSVNYRSATLFGKVNLINNVSKKVKILKSVINQMIPNRWDSLRTISDKEIERTLVLEMTIETASAKIREAGVKDEKSDLDLPIWAGIMPIKQIAEFPIGDELLAKNIEIPKHVMDYYTDNKL